MQIFSLVCFLFLSFPSHARVFSFNNESFASYLNISYGTPSRIQDQAVAKESSATQYDSSITAQPGGEFGFIYSSRYFGWRFGLEIIKPAKNLSAAKDAAGATLYSVETDLTALLPKVGLEINLRTTPRYRWLLFGYAGLATLTGKNSYSSLTISPNANFVSEWKSGASARGGGLGFEYYAFDTTTLLFEAAYRELIFSEIQYAKAVTDFNGARAVGDIVKDTNNVNREINFTGTYIGISARFWLF